MQKITTHYDNLRIARNAPQEVVRAAYKALSQKYHPDKHPNDPRATRIMTLVNQSYAVLSDTNQRREHDAWIGEVEFDLLTRESPQNDRPQDSGAFVRENKRHSLFGMRIFESWWGLSLAILVGWGIGTYSAGLTSTPSSNFHQVSGKAVNSGIYMSKRSVIFNVPFEESRCVDKPKNEETGASCLLSQRHEDTQLWIDLSLPDAVY